MSTSYLFFYWNITFVCNCTLAYNFKGQIAGPQTCAPPSGRGLQRWALCACTCIHTHVRCSLCGEVKGFHLIIKGIITTLGLICSLCFIPLPSLHVSIFPPNTAMFSGLLSCLCLPLLTPASTSLPKWFFININQISYSTLYLITYLMVCLSQEVHNKYHWINEWRKELLLTV